MVTLWAPACAKCLVAAEDLLLAPGDANGPHEPARLTVRWTCAACRAQNYVPRAKWIKREDAK